LLYVIGIRYPDFVEPSQTTKNSCPEPDTLFLTSQLQQYNSGLFRCLSGAQSKRKKDIMNVKENITKGRW
jgi:hypothetical protein